MNCFRVHALSAMALLLLASISLAPAALAQPSSTNNLHEYVGDFEGRVFSLKDATLFYFRQGMQGPIELMRIGEDHFDIVIPPGAEVQAPAGHQIPTFKFERSEKGSVITLVILNPDGSEVARYAKRPEAAAQ